MMPGALYQPYRAPGPMFSLAWSEDIDLSGGVGDLAVVKNLLPNWVSGTDAIKVEYDTFIKRILYADETVAVPGEARLYADAPIGQGGKSVTIWRQQSGTHAAFPVQVFEFPGVGFRVPAGTKLSAEGASAGSVAEQHNMVLHCTSPGVRPPLNMGNPAAGQFITNLALKTGTLVANTISGRNDILGHLASYEDSELSFPKDPANKYVLYGVVPRPGLAGVGLMGFEHPSGMYYALWPSVFIADSPIVYYLDQPWAFDGGNERAPKLVGAGAVTTSTEFQPLFSAL